MPKPLITIGITAFNAIDTIARAIQSAQLQDWDKKEIVIVDDCSTDGTWKYVSEISENESNIQAYQNSVNSGVATSRNRIIQEAQGEYVVFFDDDDVSCSSRLTKQYQRIHEYETRFSIDAPVVCHSARHIYYPNGENRIENTMGEIESNLAPFGIAVARRVLLGEPLEDGYGSCPTCSQMARRSLYLSVGMFDDNFRRSEDTELNIRIAKKGGHFIGIREPLVTQYMTKTSEKSLCTELGYMLLVIEKHKDIFTSSAHYEFCREWLVAKNLWLSNDRVKFVVKLIKLLITHPIFLSRRLCFSLPNIGLNRAFSRFHR